MTETYGGSKSKDAHTFLTSPSEDMNGHPHTLTACPMGKYFLVLTEKEAG